MKRRLDVRAVKRERGRGVDGQRRALSKKSKNKKTKAIQCFLADDFLSRVCGVTCSLSYSYLGTLGDVGTHGGEGEEDSLGGHLVYYRRTIFCWCARMGE